jgi:hypothetical protein
MADGKALRMLAVLASSTDRTKALQISTLTTVRAMRSVYCGFFWQEGCATCLCEATRSKTRVPLKLP